MIVLKPVKHRNPTSFKKLSILPPILIQKRQAPIYILFLAPVEMASSVGRAITMEDTRRESINFFSITGNNNVSFLLFTNSLLSMLFHILFYFWNDHLFDGRSHSVSFILVLNVFNFQVSILQHNVWGFYISRSGEASKKLSPTHDS